MNWYLAENLKNSVRQVVIEGTTRARVDSKFGSLMLGTKYHILRAGTWVIGYFRLDSDPGPYLLLRADGHIGSLQDQTFRVAHCFYRMRAGGLYAIFVDFPALKLANVPSGPFVLFEMIRGIDMEDERQRILDGLGRSPLHLCFAEGDGPGQDLGGGMWSGGPICAVYDVLVDVPGDCRKRLAEEWEGLLEYHRSLSLGTRDFHASIQQMEGENPLSSNPIVDRSLVVPTSQSHPEAPAPSNLPSGQGARSKPWWQFWS